MIALLPASQSLRIPSNLAFAGLLLGLDNLAFAEFLLGLDFEAMLLDACEAVSSGRNVLIHDEFGMDRLLFVLKH